MTDPISAKVPGPDSSGALDPYSTTHPPMSQSRNEGLPFNPFPTVAERDRFAHLIPEPSLPPFHFRLWDPRNSRFLLNPPQDLSSSSISSDDSDALQLAAVLFCDALALIVRDTWKKMDTGAVLNDDPSIHLHLSLFESRTERARWREKVSSLLSTPHIKKSMGERDAVAAVKQIILLQQMAYSEPAAFALLTELRASLVDAMNNLRSQASGFSTPMLVRNLTVQIRLLDTAWDDIVSQKIKRARENMVRAPSTSVDLFLEIRMEIIRVTKTGRAAEKQLQGIRKLTAGFLEYQEGFAIEKDTLLAQVDQAFDEELIASVDLLKEEAATKPEAVLSLASLSDVIRKYEEKIAEMMPDKPPRDLAHLHVELGFKSHQACLAIRPAYVFNEDTSPSHLRKMIQVLGFLAKRENPSALLELKKIAVSTASKDAVLVIAKLADDEAKPNLRLEAELVLYSTLREIDEVHVFTQPGRVCAEEVQRHILQQDKSRKGRVSPSQIIQKYFQDNDRIYSDSPLPRVQKSPPRISQWQGFSKLKAEGNLISAMEILGGQERIAEIISEWLRDGKMEMGGLRSEVEFANMIAQRVQSNLKEMSADQMTDFIAGELLQTNEEEAIGVISPRFMVDLLKENARYQPMATAQLARLQSRLILTDSMTGPESPLYQLVDEIHHYLTNLDPAFNEENPLSAGALEGLAIEGNERGLDHWVRMAAQGGQKKDLVVLARIADRGAQSIRPRAVLKLQMVLYAKAEEGNEAAAHLLKSILEKGNQCRSLESLVEQELQSKISSEGPPSAVTAYLKTHPSGVRLSPALREELLKSPTRLGRLYHLYQHVLDSESPDALYLFGIIASEEPDDPAVIHARHLAIFIPRNLILKALMTEDDLEAENPRQENLLRFLSVYDQLFEEHREKEERVLRTTRISDSGLMKLRLGWHQKALEALKDAADQENQEKQYPAERSPPLARNEQSDPLPGEGKDRVEWTEPPRIIHGKADLPGNAGSYKVVRGGEPGQVEVLGGRSERPGAVTLGRIIRK